MQVIIPMSGFGERFRRAGYKVPKPLIEVDSRPIISYVVDLFSDSDDFIFICNKEHIKTTNMRKTLISIAPNCEIVEIEAHKKGPIYATLMARNFIDNTKPTIVNYCDFTCYWNYKHFCRWLKDSNIDGAIPAYKGFHPHSSGATNYAYIKENGNFLLEIQEKKPFTSDKTSEYASSGTYYFRSGELMKKYFQYVLDENININGEHYCSLAYNKMVKDNLKIGIYSLQHFMQWGTPQDLEEYNYWSNIFKYLNNTKTNNESKIRSHTLVTMAGKGSRFKIQGYSTPKPLLPISGKSMVIQAVKSLPSSNGYTFVCNELDLLNSNLMDKIENQFKLTSVVKLKKVLNGQALSALEALKHIPENIPITVTSCDHALLYSYSKLEECFNLLEFDMLIWGANKCPWTKINPKMYGWVETEDFEVEETYIKEEPRNYDNAYVITGTFSFRNKQILEDLITNLISRKGKINNEYYIDSLINDCKLRKKRALVFPVEYYVCWGTPLEYESFIYWQSCFHKWHSHSYSWSNDIWNKDERISLDSLKHIEDFSLDQKVLQY